MFLIKDENRLPFQSAVAGVGAGVWAVVEQWTPGDLLGLRVSSAGTRGIPRVVWMDLTSGAAVLDQFIDGGNVLRGAAVLNARIGCPVEEWQLHALSEIRVGATEFSELDRRLVTVTQFTTAAGQKFSVPRGFAEKHARGRRVWRTPSPAAHTAGQPDS